MLGIGFKLVEQEDPLGLLRAIPALGLSNAEAAELAIAIAIAREIPADALKRRYEPSSGMGTNAQEFSESPYLVESILDPICSEKRTDNGWPRIGGANQRKVRAMGLRSIRTKANGPRFLTLGLGR